MAETVSAWLYDGRVALRHEREVGCGVQGSLLISGNGESETIPFDRLRWIEDRNGLPVFGHADRVGWRLGFNAELPSTLRDALPGRRRYGGFIDRIGLAPAVGAFAAISVLLVIGGMKAMDWAVMLVPDRWETKLGDATFSELGKSCAGQQGGAALSRLAERLAPGAKPLRIRVVDIGMTNAAALPGRQVVIFRGLIDQAKSPDEVAGVLGHEIGHVEHRDPLKGLVRELGLGLLASQAGGQTGSRAGALLSLRYSRSAEREADSYAANALRMANISSAATADFFKRMARDEARLGRVSNLTAYLSSHPMSAQRQSLFTDAAKHMSHAAPAMTPGEWEALRGICKGR